MFGYQPFFFSFAGHAMHPEKAVAGCDSNDTVIMLAHQPNAAKMMLNDQTVSTKLDLILSGKALLFCW